MSTLPTPNGCGVCGLPERGHFMCWDAVVGLHYWTNPTPAQRLDRMRARRVPARVDEAAPVRVRMLRRTPNHTKGQIGTLHDASPSGHVNKCLKWVDYGEPIQWSFGQSESAGEWCSPSEYEVVDEAATGGQSSDTCRHGQPEAGCASCDACAACDGSCGTCPFAGRTS